MVDLTSTFAAQLCIVISRFHFKSLAPAAFQLFQWRGRCRVRMSLHRAVAYLRTLDLRGSGERDFIREIALQSSWSCGLACLSFFWPFAILESVALDRELRGEDSELCHRVARRAQVGSRGAIGDAMRAVHWSFTTHRRSSLENMRLLMKLLEII